MNVRRIGKDDFIFSCAICGVETPIAFHLGADKEEPLWKCGTCVSRDA